ncbi:Uncharacterised protein [Mycobacterium tuberculosis]|nr:Uncharacterised protein [Mycobacterium tuberculosis]
MIYHEATISQCKSDATIAIISFVFSKNSLNFSFDSLILIRLIQLF